MKTNLFLSGVMIFMAGCSTQLKTDQVPSVVDNTIKSKFAGAGDIDWKKVGNNYEAEFKVGETEYTAEVDSTGALLRSRVDIKTSDLPLAIIQFLEKQYSANKIDDAEKLEIQGVQYYQVELENKPKDIGLVFSIDGIPAPGQTYWD